MVVDSAAELVCTSTTAMSRGGSSMTLATAAKWLRGASVATASTGLMATAASHPATQGPWLLLFDLLDWPMNGHPSGFTEQAHQLNAVMGGLMVGWGTMMYALCGDVLERSPVAVSRCMLGGVLSWFVVDSAGSLVANPPGNVVLNVLFLGMFAPPLIALQRMKHDD